MKWYYIIGHIIKGVVVCIVVNFNWHLIKGGGGGNHERLLKEGHLKRRRQSFLSFYLFSKLEWHD